MKEKKIKKLAKKFRENMEKYLTEDSYYKSKVKFLKEETGRDWKDSEILAFAREVNKLGIKQRIAEKEMRIKIKTALYNEIERQKGMMSLVIRKRLEDYIGKKLFLKNGWNSKAWEPFEMPEKLKLRKEYREKYGFESKSLSIRKEGDHLIVKFIIGYAFPGASEQKANGHVYVGRLEEEQTLKELYPLYEAQPKVSWKVQAQLLKEKEKVEAQLSAIKGKIKLEHY